MVAAVNGMNKNLLKISGLIFFASLVLSGCAINQDFQTAQVENSLQGWANFTQKYPVANHPDCDVCKAAQQNYEAALSAQKAQWEQAQDENTPAAYLRFMNKNSPNDPHYEAARQDALSELEKGHGAEEDYARYLARYPEEPAASRLRKALAKLRFQKAIASDNASAEAFFVAEYPRTSLGAEMKRRLESAEFKNARGMDTRVAYQFFLKRFPEAPERAQVEAGLAQLPAAVEVTNDGSALDLLPRLRQASPALRNEECLSLFSATMDDAGDPYGAKAEGARNEFLSGQQSESGLPEVCADTRMGVPQAHRSLVSSALRALARLSQREQSLSRIVPDPAATIEQAKDIGKSADDLSQQAESFDLEMQAFYGYMPADPDKPTEKASKDAKEAERRARRAYEIASRDERDSKGSGAEAVLSLMERQADLLTRIIAYYEKPEGARP